MKGLIYKVTNKIDNKAYIGQTIRPLNIRIERHLKDAKYGSKLIFHKALKKYGIEKFHIEILEENISQNKLNERERFWIKKYNTYFKNGYGYNMTEGGDYFNTNRKLSDDEISDIIYLLKKAPTLSEVDIAKKFNVTIYAVSDINRGKTWRQENESYPLRQQDIKELSEEEFHIIIKMLKTRLFSEQYIADKYKISDSVISKINTGKYNKFPYPENEIFPIITNKVVSNTKISTKNIFNLLIDYLTLNITKYELAKKYNISVSYVKGIYLGQNSKHLLIDLIFPLKKNRNENIKIINNKLNLLKEYE